MNGISTAVILAAGMGKRMGSLKPKAVCEVLGKPMIEWVVDTCKNTGISNICVVASHEGALPLGDDINVCYQKEKLGTGHAVMMATEFLEKSDAEEIIVLYGDTPLITEKCLKNAYLEHNSTNNKLTVISAVLDDPAKYGRILREGDTFSKIVEYADASNEIRAIREVNSGIYIFNRKLMLELLPYIKSDNAQKEYYLTDLVEIFAKNGHKVGCYKSPDSLVLKGANDRKGLAELNEIARDMVLDLHYENGVDIPLGSSVMISPNAKIGRDSLILQSVVIEGDTIIGENVRIEQGVTLKNAVIGDNSVIGAGSYIEGSKIGTGTKILSCSRVVDSEIGNDTEVISSMITKSTVGNTVRLGPYSQLRPNSSLADNVKIGNFVEVKNSSIGNKTSVAHLTYIGDIDVGERCNFGCGVVTVNYDGKSKYRSKVGNDVFIGCNSNIMSPVEIGDESYIAAATTITESIPPKAFSIGRVRQTIKENYSKMPNKKKED